VVDLTSTKRLSKTLCVRQVWVRRGAIPLHLISPNSFINKGQTVNSPTRSSCHLLLLLIKISSWRFCGGVDFLKLINEDIVSNSIKGFSFSLAPAPFAVAQTLHIILGKCPSGKSQRKYNVKGFKDVFLEVTFKEKSLKLFELFPFRLEADLSARRAVQEPYRGTSLTRYRLPLGPKSGICIGSYGAPRGGAVSYERGTPVRREPTPHPSSKLPKPSTLIPKPWTLHPKPKSHRW
jgi:hypothetical protein